jgi:hypothetical protein
MWGKNVGSMKRAPLVIAKFGGDDPFSSPSRPAGEKPSQPARDDSRPAYSLTAKLIGSGRVE